MRRISLFALLFGLIVCAGCGKKPAPPPPDDTPTGPPTPAEAAAERNKLLAGLKNSNQATRLSAIEDLSWLAEDDPAVLQALVDMMKDRGTAGPGRTFANQVNS